MPPPPGALAPWQGAGTLPPPPHALAPRQARLVPNFGPRPSRSFNMQTAGLLERERVGPPHVSTHGGSARPPHRRGRGRRSSALAPQGHALRKAWARQRAPAASEEPQAGRTHDAFSAAQHRPRPHDAQAPHQRAPCAFRTPPPAVRLSCTGTRCVAPRPLPALPPRCAQ